MYDFITPTSDIRIIAKAVSEVIHELYKPDTRFYRCGIGAIELESEYFYQIDMFNKNADNPKIMKFIDTVNNRYGVGALCIGSENLTQKWAMKRAFFITTLYYTMVQYTIY